jgi:predicted DNA-binding transcriptional regulator AlpA
MEEENELLTAPEVGKILGVTSRSINVWCESGDFPNAYRINPSRPRSHWRIPRGDVDAFIAKRRAQRGFIRLPVAAVQSEPESVIG